MLVGRSDNYVFTSRLRQLPDEGGTCFEGMWELQRWLFAPSFRPSWRGLVLRILSLSLQLVLAALPVREILNSALTVDRSGLGLRHRRTNLPCGTRVTCKLTRNRGRCPVSADLGHRNLFFAPHSQEAHHACHRPSTAVLRSLAFIEDDLSGTLQLRVGAIRRANKSEKRPAPGFRNSLAPVGEFPPGQNDLTPQ